MNCTEATALMSQAQDRTLGGGERINLRWHTVICSGCRNYGRQLLVLREASRRMAHGLVPGADLPLQDASDDSPDSPPIDPSIDPPKDPSA
jgi:hypothetical protein